MFRLEVSLCDCLLFDSWSADQEQISAVLPILGARFLQEALPRGLVLRLCPLLLVIGIWQLFDAECCDLTRDNTTKSGAF